MENATPLNKLLAIQFALKAPKDLMNKFGRYKYRSCERILEELKPLLKQHNLTLTLTDDIISINNRVYVRATAALYDDTVRLAVVTAYAREEEAKKGMDSSQITGAASSYARKYALNGLFLIDDARDSDATNNGDSGDSYEHEDMPSISTNATEAQTEKTSSAPQDGPNLAKGLIIAMSEKNKGGYVTITIEGYKDEDGRNIKFSSNNPAILATLAARMNAGEPVGLTYSITKSGRWLNYSITEVLEEVPF